MFFRFIGPPTLVFRQMYDNVVGSYKNQVVVAPIDLAEKNASVMLAIINFRHLLN